MTMRAIRYLLAVFCVLGVAVVPGGQQAALAQQLDAQTLGDGMELFRVRSNFYVLTGAGVNIGIQIGSDGVVLVDAGDAAHADRVIAELKKLTPRLIRYIINTNGDADHVGGNEKIAKAGKSLVPAGDGLATILAPTEVTLRLSLAGYPSGAWPTEAFIETLRRDMHLNDEAIEVLHQPNAHTDGDSLVFFRRSDVLMAGDIIDMRRFPVIDLEHDGSINGEIAALNRIIDIAIPSVPLVSREAGTVVVPSHGRLLQEIDVVEYRDMVTVVRDRIASLMKEGKSLAQVKASNPTRGYTKRYGSDTGSWTTDMFVEAVFKSLAAERSKRR